MSTGALRASGRALQPLMSLRPASTAFLLCDIQERFRPMIWNYPHVINTASKLIAGGKLLDIPLIVTEQNPKALGKTVSELDISHAKIVEAKTKFSMWIPAVEQFMKQNLGNNPSAVLFGIESHVCVMQTALDLLDNNVSVYVVADGVSSCNRGEVKLALARLREAGAVISSSEAILFQLLRDSSHDKFRDMSKLIKQTSEPTRAALDQLVSPNL
ncbi:Isochorismatase-like protein [Phlyctochytrium arcticum]|nr:Isochorismatase-like protein [Phlyctochytrium arcticum]